MEETIREAAHELASSIAGAVLRPQDPGYDDARSDWNGAIDCRPAAIVRCAGAADVAAAIKFARAHNLEISVCAGGHNFASLNVCDGGLMINLADMSAVSVDAIQRRAVCGGGATCAQVDAATQAHGLAVPGGTVSHTGIGGLTLDGGVGWLTAKAGLTCDNLVSAEVVAADGRLLHASTDENPDLYWALRGGGGNVGVVTSFEYRLHEVGPLVHVGLFFWGLGEGAAALRKSRELANSLPEDVGVMIAGLNAPPVPFVPEPHRFLPGYAFIVVGFGNAEQHREAIAPAREARPLFELVTPMPFTSVQAMLDEMTPRGAFAHEKAMYVDAFSDGVIDVFTAHLPRKNSPLSLAFAMPLNGAYTRVGDDETAFGCRRTRSWLLTIRALAPTRQLFKADRSWVRDFGEALRPHASNCGTARYQRLARVKGTYDPDNVLHLNPTLGPERP
jgi:hypothetical protein